MMHEKEFQSLVLPHRALLTRTARGLTRNPEDAEDLVQETFLRAFRAADRFEPGTNLRAWLFTILHNAARNRARDDAREAVVIDSETVERAAELAPGAGQPTPGSTPESLLIRETLAPELQAAIDALLAGAAGAQMILDGRPLRRRELTVDERRDERVDGVATMHDPRSQSSVWPTVTGV